MTVDPAKELKEFKPKHKFFVGIDSDGCAFDTMEIKHKECFIPNIIQYWGLQAVSKYAREAAEFVNLYSEWRGINRFPAIMMVFDLLRDRKRSSATSRQDSRGSGRAEVHRFGPAAGQPRPQAGRSPGRRTRS